MWVVGTIVSAQCWVVGTIVSAQSRNKPKGCEEIKHRIIKSKSG